MVVYLYILERKGVYIGHRSTMMSRAGMFHVLKGITMDVNNGVFKLHSFHNMESILDINHAFDLQFSEYIAMLRPELSSPTPHSGHTLWIKWHPPPVGYWKLNVDGSSLCNPGKAGIGREANKVADVLAKKAVAKQNTIVDYFVAPAFFTAFCWMIVWGSTVALQMDASERYQYNPTLQWNPRVEEYFIKAYGADHFARISKSLTSPSCYSCIRVNTLKLTSDAIIEKLLSTLPGIRQQSGTDGMNQRDINAEYLIGPDHKESHIPSTSYDLKKANLTVSESAQNCPVSKCQLPGLDYVVFVKGSGPHTVNYGYAQDKPPKEVIVSRKCAEAVLRGAQVS
ncbi:hypothetical protein C3L33_13231, partial [Rhododendron williamsianum]